MPEHLIIRAGGKLDLVEHLVISGATMVEINYWTNGKIGAKVAFPRYTESVKFRSQSRETASKKENHTEDWALGSHHRDNGHVTH